MRNYSFKKIISLREFFAKHPGCYVANICFNDKVVCCFEGPERLSDDLLDSIVKSYSIDEYSDGDCYLEYVLYHIELATCSQKAIDHPTKPIVFGSLDKLVDLWFAHHKEIKKGESI